MGLYARLKETLHTTHYTLNLPLTINSTHSTLHFIQLFALQLLALSFLFLQRPLIHQELLEAHNQNSILVIVPYHIVLGHNNLPEPVTYIHQRTLLLLPFFCCRY